MEHKDYYEKKENIQHDEILILLQNLNKILEKIKDKDNIDEIFIKERKKIDTILEENRIKFSQTMDKKYLLSDECLGELNTLLIIYSFGVIDLTIKEQSAINNFYQCIVNKTGIGEDLQTYLIEFNNTKEIKKKEIIFDKMYRKYQLSKLKESLQIEAKAEWEDSLFDYNINWKDYTDFNIPKNEQKFQYDGAFKTFNRENIHFHNENNGDRLGDSPKASNRAANIYLPKCRETYQTLKNIPGICNEDTFIKAVTLQECSHKNYNASESESEIPSLEIGGRTYLSFRLPTIIDTYYNSNIADSIGPGYSLMYKLYAETLKELVSKDQSIEEKITKNKDKTIQSCITPGEEINFDYKSFTSLFTKEFTEKFITIYKRKVQETSKKYK